MLVHIVIDICVLFMYFLIFSYNIIELSFTYIS